MIMLAILLGGVVSAQITPITNETPVYEITSNGSLMINGETYTAVGDFLLDAINYIETPEVISPTIFFGPDEQGTDRGVGKWKIRRTGAGRLTRSTRSSASKTTVQTDDSFLYVINGIPFHVIASNAFCDVPYPGELGRFGTSFTGRTNNVMLRVEFNPVVFLDSSANALVGFVLEFDDGTRLEWFYQGDIDSVDYDSEIGSWSVNHDGDMEIIEYILNSDSGLEEANETGVFSRVTVELTGPIVDVCRTPPGE